ncbi:MAG: hypothetical protein RQ875_09495 [Vicingaceae bacterium]|nr:hypothetical protein [Vicingaceae bacterium]
MAGNTERIKKKHNDIEKMYIKLSVKKFNGKTLYSHDAILEMIADKFYLEPITIDSILSKKR